MSRAVIFDVDGVLVHGAHSRPGEIAPWDSTLFEDLGIEPKRLTEAFIHDSFIKQVQTGKMSLIEALDRALPAIGYRGSSMAFVSYWLAHDSIVDAPLVDLVGRLKQSPDATLYLATNQDHLRAFWLWETLGLNAYFADIFYSARIGAIKPAQPYFDWIVHRLGPQSEPPLFFDDREANIKVARANGWEAVHYNRIEDCASHPWIAERLSAVSIVTSR